MARAATCDGPTKAPKATAAARVIPLACKIFKRWTESSAEMSEASVRVVARRIASLTFDCLSSLPLGAGAGESKRVGALRGRKYKY
jgi:hypothetical protein